MSNCSLLSEDMMLFWPALLVSIPLVKSLDVAGRCWVWLAEKDPALSVLRAWGQHLLISSWLNDLIMKVAGLVLSWLPRSHRSYFEFILPPLQLLVAICCFCTFPSSLLYEGTTWLFSSPAFLAKCDLVSRAKLYLEPSAEEKRETASSTACEVPSLKWRIIWGVCLRSCDLLSFVL